MVKEISVFDLKARLDKGEKVTLIDVREPIERDIANLGGALIPLSELNKRVNEIPRQGEVIVYCKAGGRSRHAVQELSVKAGFTNLINLSGGVLAWANKIDPSMRKY